MSQSDGACSGIEYTYNLAGGRVHFQTIGRAIKHFSFNALIARSIVLFPKEVSLCNSAFVILGFFFIAAKTARSLEEIFIFANMYLLYFIKFSDERNFYKLQAEMMEQQAKLQYESYEIQSDKYKEAMSILLH